MMELTFREIDAPDGVTVIEDGPRWQIANESGETRRVRSVARVYDLTHAGRLRMFAHGYQSWTWSGLGVVGEDVDGSLVEGSVGLTRGMHHADQRVARPGEVRAELVTVLADDDDVVLLGADGGDRHDTTIRVVPTGHGTAEVRVEAFLGDVEIPSGGGVSLHGLLSAEPSDVSSGLAWWAGTVGRLNRARTSAPFQLGWCSWYQYFHGVTEADIRANLAGAADWPFEVFQIDDGFQSSIGDWMSMNDKFGSSHDTLAADIDAAGMVPGIWLAPFLAAPESAVAQAHPDWIAEHKPGRPLIGMVNGGWGGAVHTLDTTHPEVLDHIESIARSLVEAGYRYLKVDFTYAPGLDGVFYDPTVTPAARVRAGYDALRRGAGDDVFILGCGAPMGPCIGVVDGMRIGADVAPWWDVQDDQWRPPGYEPHEPATANALQNTITRSFMHRRLWLNDPDCHMLRTTDTRMSEAAIDSWARAVGVSGGMALVSDDLSLLDDHSRRRLDEAVALGRSADAAAVDGEVAVAPDLLDRHRCEVLAGPVGKLHVDPHTQVSTLTAG